MSRVKTPDDSLLQALAKELAKNVKSQKDLSNLTSQLVKMTVEAALNSEMEEHLGYAKNSPQGHNTGNNRNGHSQKLGTLPLFLFHIKFTKIQHIAISESSPDFLCPLKDTTRLPNSSISIFPTMPYNRIGIYTIKPNMLVYMFTAVTTNF